MLRIHDVEPIEDIELKLMSYPSGGIALAGREIGDSNWTVILIISDSGIHRVQIPGLLGALPKNDDGEVLIWLRNLGHEA